MNIVAAYYNICEGRALNENYGKYLKIVSIGQIL